MQTRFSSRGDPRRRQRDDVTLVALAHGPQPGVEPDGSDPPMTHGHELFHCEPRAGPVVEREGVDVDARQRTVHRDDDEAVVDVGLQV